MSSVFIPSVPRFLKHNKEGTVMLTPDFLCTIGFERLREETKDTWMCLFLQI